ncbi:MAG: hypothetical protein NTY15_04135 [Planctomycetota bacterium]|nr:hypothetical protein [Planctomycetota bacterium]
MTSHVTTPTNEPSVASGPAADDAHRAEMLAYYWQKGIPSVILAIVTLVLAGYSYWFVQPNVKQRYRDLCARNFLLLEGNSPDLKKPEKNETKQPWQFETNDNNSATDASQRGSDERRRLLEQTQLCLRRLIIGDKSDDSVRYQSALVANLLADWYLDRARALPPGEGNQDDMGSLVSRSLAERKKAADAMRAVQKLDGKFAAKALLWTTRQQLHDNLELPPDELATMATRISELLANGDGSAEEIKVEVGACLAEIFVRRSLSVASLDRVDKEATENKVETLEIQPQVLSFFDTAKNASIADLAWAAEAMSIVDLTAGQAMATRAMQAFWAKGENDPVSVETLVSVFRSLILVNSIKESQVLLSERIPQIAPFEQARFRSLAAAACLRQIVLNAIADKQGTDSTQTCPVLFSLSLQLNPESEQALAMLEMVSNPMKLEASSLRMKKLMGMSVEGAKLGRTDPGLDGGMRSLLSASVGLHESPISDEALSNLTAAVKATAVHGIVASRLAMRLVASESIRVEEAIRWIGAINVASPEVLGAWSDRAKLHLQNKEYAKAIECYEFMLGKLPGNEQVVEAIEAAKSQLNGEAK